MADRILDYDGSWFKGVKSDLDPGQCPLGYAWMTVNMLNVGNLLSCRPGYRCVVTFPKGKLQGATIFRPAIGLEQLVVCIDGAIYAAPYPFVNFRLLQNVQMSPTAKQIFWCQTTQSARATSTEFVSATEIIPSREVLFIQDGANTAPAWYDGADSGHIRDRAFETPAGSSMAWVGDRLWVANGNSVFASDISNPFSFREQIYQGSVSAFVFPREVTAMIRTASLEFPQLLVFTRETTSLIQANIRARNSWPTTDNMQTDIFPVGCSSQRSLVSHFGRISWFSQGGFVYFDAATVGKLSARIPVRDNEMMASKSKLNEDLSLVAGAAYGQYLLLSVPSEDSYNKHTWVLNDASLETLSDDSGPSWSGYWVGTRPVEWIYGDIAGAERIYHVSVDEDGENRLWEAFQPNRMDNGCPIAWSLETRGYFGATSQQSKKLPGSDCKFGFADFGLVGIEEDLDIAVYYAGGLRGAYKKIMSKRVKVERGCLSFDREITATTQLFAYKPQSRRLRTEDANVQSTEEDTGSCPVESDKTENEDESFQLLFAGHGPAAFRFIRAFAFTTPEDLSGDPKACEDETGFNAIRFDGAGVQSEDLDDTAALDAELAAKELSYFTSNQTALVDVNGIAAVGVGFCESIVSQKAADRVALRIATRMAETEVLKQLPKILGVGLE